MTAVLGNVVMGMEKWEKMWGKVGKCWKMCWRPVFYILLIYQSIFQQQEETFFRVGGEAYGHFTLKMKHKK